MKQSVDLMNSMKLMNSRHSNTTTTTTSLARRALLLLTLFVMSVGSAWGDPTFQEEGSISVSKDGGTFYLGTPSSGMSFNVLEKIGGSSQLLADINEALGSTVYTNIDDLWKNIYVRWIGIQGDGNVAKIVGNNYIYYSNEAWNFAGVGDYASAFRTLSEKFFYTYYYGPDQIYWNPGWWGKDTFENDLFGLTWFYNGYASNLSDAKIVCYVSTIDQVGATKGNDHGQGSFSTEGTLLVKYTFLAKKKPDTFSGKLKSGGQALSGGAVVGKADQLTTSATSATLATLDFSAALAQASSSTYVRFYLEKDGEAVDPTGKLTVTGGTAGPDKEHGFYIYKSGGLSSTDVDNDVTLELTAGEYEDYQVVAVFGSGEPSGDPLHEVDWDLQYKYTFEYPFKGDASSATEVEKTFTMTESKKNQTLTMEFDIANDKITLKDDSDNELGTATVDASSFWSAIGSSLSGSQPFYVRWFLQDKSGAEATSLASAGAIVDGGSSLYAAPAKDRYGLYFSTTNGTNALNDIMKINVNGSKVSDLAKYDLVCTIATDLTGEVFDVSSKLTHEPNAMVLKYVLKFEDAEWAGTIAVDAKTHSKEVLIPTASTTEIDVPLSDSFTKILSENGSRTPTGLAHDPNEFHIRWYVEKSDGSNYIAISNPEDLLSTVTVSNEGNATQRHKTKAGYGIYWSSLTNYDASNNHYNPIAGDATSNKSTDDVKKLLNIHFTKPSADEWSEYRLVAVMTKDLTGAVAAPTTGERELDKEPTTLDIVYYFKFFVEDEFQFVHDKGASGRDYITAADDSRIAGTVQQYNWDNDTSTKETVSGDVRQGVHTVEYNIYVDPSSTTPVRLKLPFQNYFGTGNNLEPLAYIRWYDWTTDMGSDKLTAVGTWLENTDVKTKERGLFMLNNSLNGQSPYHDRVGVTFNPYGITGTIVIACDVSKYYDGIYQGSANDSRTDFTGLKKPYLMHEPTLSTRYIFNIRPASVIADLIKTGADKFAVNDEHKFELAEDNGRVAVAIKDASTSFSVRTNSPQLTDYYVYDVSDGLVNCTKVTWEAYLEDEGGLWKRKVALVGNGTDRISSFTVSQLSGNYELVTDNTQTKSVTAGNGMRFHLVASLGDGTTMVPTVHYEMNLQEAPAYAISNLPLERTAEYLENNMTLQSTLNFDERLGLTSTIASQSVNHTSNPFLWDEAEYGFCYPQIDEYRIWTLVSGDYSGLSAIHGDYMLLKSMNAPYISEKDATYDYKYHWYISSPTLYDYTKTHGSGEYGTFLYVDASDESRTITKLNFTADLCAGSELCFTGVIANMTDGDKKPQVMATVYAVDGAGDKTRVVSFLSSDLSTTVTGSSYSDGEWNQFYGRIAIPSGINLSGVDHYEVDIDNYALNTDGADYCLDEIKFYTSTGKMTVEQTGGMCLDDNLALTASMTAELLEHKIPTLSSTPTKIYYRVFKRTSAEGVTPVTYEPYDDSFIYNNGGKDYGETTACKAVLNSDGSLDNSTPEKTEQNKGYYIEKGVLRFKVIDNKVFNLPQGDYFFALTNVLPFTGTPTTALSDWANPNDACDVFSNFFVPRKMGISFTKAGFVVSNVIGAGCGGGTPSVSDYKVMLKVPDATEASGFKTYDSQTEGVTFTFYKGSTAAEALTNAQNTTGAISSGTYTITYSPLSVGTNYFVAVPSKTTLSDSKTICTYIPFTFIVTNAGPALELGFNDVTYPSGYERVVRIGKEQLDNLKSNSYILHVPVQSFKDKNGNTANDILLEDHFTLYGTTDPLIAKAAGKTYEVETTTTKVAEFVNTKDSKPIVNTTYMYLPLNFANNAVTFHEGFEYKIHTTFCDVNDASDAGACHPDLYLIIKVVPEYVTWNDEGTTVTPNTNVGTNWSNDANWSRSSKAELYSTTYQDNTDINASLTPTPATYVPMKFTYVTIPTGNVAPKLINLAKGTDGIYNNIGTGATSNIQYDMMVKVENECGHSISGDIYDCEKFYSNICKEIYFKPSAELINQQYLTYEKAWVEKEMTSNTWYLMSTPLRDTYAGDMFVPLSATATKNGRQETEAFQAITFPDQADATYSRTKYPFYQHSWGNTFGSTVRVASNDNYRTDYSAKLQSSAVTETAFANWGHSFNDVQEPYTTRTAFAIRAHKKTQGTAALIRLPKTNTTYNYFDWKDTNPTVDPKTSGVKTITKDGYGKLLVDKDQNATQFEVAVATLQSVGGYVLVGNPYMASIDMTSFLTANSLAGYWTYEGSAVTAMTDGKIRPLQGFFVKKESGNITFTPAMMVDGNHATDTPAPSREFTMTASSNRGQSAASVSVGEEEKSVETLFDSNLTDVPMVYTVADGQAVSINQVKELSKPIAFGVTCTASNEMVDVTFSDIEKLTSGEVYVVDAVDGTSQQIYEGDSFAVQPNDYGRYFLTFTGGSATGIEETASAQQGIVVSVRGREVTVTSGEDISQIQAVSLNGSTIYQNNSCGNSVTFMLHAGVYVIQAKNTAGVQQNVKIFVK